MKTPSIESSRLMPAANSTGRQRIAYQGSENAAAPPASTSRDTSVAVSNPSPKSRPTGYMWRGLRTAFVTPPRSRFMKPRCERWWSSSTSSKSPAFIPWKTCQIFISTTRFRMPMRMRKVPDTLVPMSPRVFCSAELPSST